MGGSRMFPWETFLLLLKHLLTYWHRKSKLSFTLILVCCGFLDSLSFDSIRFIEFGENRVLGNHPRGAAELYRALSLFVSCTRTNSSIILLIEANEADGTTSLVHLLLEPLHRRSRLWLLLRRFLFIDLEMDYVHPLLLLEILNGSG